MGETLATDDSGATVSLEPGTLQVLLPGEDVKFSSRLCLGRGGNSLVAISEHWDLALIRRRGQG